MELIKTKTILRRKKGAPVTARTAGDGGGYSSGDTGYAERAAYAEAAGMIRGMNDVLYPVDSAGNRVEWYSPEIHAIKAVKTLFSVQGVSARGLSETEAGGGTGGTSTLGGLTDVTLGTTLKTGDALVYDGTKWTNQPVKVGIDENALATYLSVNGYVTQSALENYYTKSEADERNKRLTTYYSSRPTSANVNFGNKTGLYTFLATSSMTEGKPAMDSHILHLEWDNGLSWGAQIAVPAPGDMQWRFQDGTIWQNWRTLLDNENFATILDSSYVKKSGDTMSGLLKISSAGWGQQLTVHRTNGTASIYFHNGVTEAGYIYFENNKYLYVGGNGIKIGTNQYDVWHSGNDGSGSGLDADMLDGQHSSSFLRIVGEASSNGLDSPWTYPAIKPYYNCLPDGDGISNAYSYGEVVSFGAYPYSTRFEFYCSDRSSANPTDSDTGLYFRSGWSSGKKPWRRLATVDGNIASATKLQTSRKIFGIDFNGENDVVGDMSGVGLITFANGQEIYCPSGEFALNLNSGTRLLTGNATGVAIGYGSPRYKLDVRGSLIADGWLRTTGAAGWYSEDYGGGWYMQGSTYIENYGVKRVKLTGPQSYYDLWLAGGGVCCEGNAGWGWNAGYGCINAGCANNSAQTPLIVAYRNGADFQNGEAGRLFSMELLNNGSQVWLNFGGTNRFKFWATGELFAQAGVWSYGYMSSRGQNTDSDIRLKDILGDCPLTVEQVAELPAVRFRWKDNGIAAVGTIAQEVRKVLPELVTERPQDGMLGVDYGVLGWLAAHAVAVRVTEHESRLERIEKLLGITE